MIVLAPDAPSLQVFTESSVFTCTGFFSFFFFLILTPGVGTTVEMENWAGGGLSGHFFDLDNNNNNNN